MAGQKQTGAWCSVCRQQRLFVAPTPSHLLHLVLTILTFGLWLIVWLIIGGKTGPFRCTVCGSTLNQKTSKELPPPAGHLGGGHQDHCHPRRQADRVPMRIVSGVLPVGGVAVCC